MSSTSTPSRRLVARRGSSSAPDPLGKHASLNHDPGRSLSSTLTIVRVIDPASPSGTPVPPPSLPEQPASPTFARRSGRRHGTTTVSSADNRLSFAFSSFSPLSPQPSSPTSGPQTHPNSRAGSSPSSSPRLRPSSPQFTRRHSASGTSAFSKPNLSPEQLVDLAHQSFAPRYVSTPSTPHPSHTDSSAVAPATFTLLPADVYLPFVDRAAETANLLSTPPTKKLFSLLAQTFPVQTSPEQVQDPFLVEPTRWTFTTLRRWLTEVDRPSADDILWVGKARKCVLAHSELIWERLKGALGVPPELESEVLDSFHFVDTVQGAPVISSEEDEDVPDDLDQSHPSPDALSLSSSPEQSLVIEPIIATSSSNPPTSGTNHPPSSLPAGLSQSQADQVLQDIIEDGEEEEELSSNKSDDNRVKSEDNIKAQQIHGLRVCTSPVLSSSAITPHVLSYPPSPVISMNASGRNSVEPRSPDVFPPLTRRLSRTSSHGSVSSLGRPMSASYMHRDFSYNATFPDIGDTESERAYDPVGDRGPGNPLFPSNFARLALGPTLRANNPSLRSPHGVTARLARWAPGSRPPSWIEGWDATKHEYAATIASGSSVGNAGE